MFSQLPSFQMAQEYEWALIRLGVKFLWFPIDIVSQRNEENPALGHNTGNLMGLPWSSSG